MLASGDYAGRIRFRDPETGRVVKAGDRFGASVYLARSASSMVVGAPGEDVGSISNASLLPTEMSRDW